MHHAVPVVGRGTIQRIHEGAGSQFRTVQRIADHFQVPTPVLLSADVPKSYRLSEPTASSDYAREGEPKSYGPSLDHALPVVLDAMARAAERAKLRAALLALLEDDSPAYRARIAELLSPPRGS